MSETPPTPPAGPSPTYNPAVPSFDYRRLALDFAIQRSPSAITAESVVKDAAAFEEYLRNGATK